jgi:uncharacterized protein YggE
MNTGTQITLITVSTLSLVTSAATLTVMLVGVRRMRREVADVKNQAKNNLNRVKAALASLDV